MKLTEVQQQWIADLRSGNYAQGRNHLKTETKEVGIQYCCLGVAAERLTTKVTHGGTNDKLYYRFDGEGAWLSDRLVKQLGLKNKSGQFRVSLLPTRWSQWIYGKTNVVAESTSLAALNDRGVSFEVIADLLEQHPWVFFVPN